MSKKKPITPKEESKAKATAVPIEWHVPDGLITPFATNMLVQIIEHEFKLSFFEIKPQIRLESNQPLPDKIRADYIASVIVTADRLPRFIEALQSQLEKYKTVRQAKVQTKLSLPSGS